MHWPATLAIIIFLAGSALSGLSQSMAELIAFRAIQGLGAGGLMVGAMATLGDIVAPRERGQRSRQPAARTRALTGAQPPGTPNGRWRWYHHPFGVVARRLACSFALGPEGELPCCRFPSCWRGAG